MLRFTTAIAAALLWAAPALAQARDFWDWRDHPYWGWGHMMFGGASMIIFWGAVIVLVILLVRWLGVSDRVEGTKLPSGPSPLDILKERYARGELDTKDFEERKKKLME